MLVVTPVAAPTVNASTLVIGNTFTFNGDVCIAIDASAIGGANVPAGGVAAVKLSNGGSLGLNSFSQVTVIAYKAVLV